MDRSQFPSYILLTSLLWRYFVVLAAELPLSEIPAFTQATSYVGTCVERWSSDLSVSYGCPSAEPAICLCTDALKSLRAATSIRSCASYLDRTNAQTATEIWASYCSINAGVSARDETLVEDIPLYTRVTNNIASCVLYKTSSYKSSFGCDDYTRAPCLCGAQESYDAVQAAINTCLYSSEYRESASSLWSSFCNINIQTPATRAIESPQYVITGAGSPATTTPSDGDSNAPQTSASGASRTTATPSNTSPPGETPTQTQSSSSNTTPITTYVVPIVIGVVVIAIVVAVLKLYRRPRPLGPKLLMHTPPYVQTHSRPESLTRSSDVTLTYPLQSYAGSSHPGDVTPWDSVSNIGARNSYPQQMEQSLVSTRL